MSPVAKMKRSASKRTLSSTKSFSAGFKARRQRKKEIGSQALALLPNLAPAKENLFKKYFFAFLAGFFCCLLLLAFSSQFKASLGREATLRADIRMAEPGSVPLWLDKSRAMSDYDKARWHAKVAALSPGSDDLRWIDEKTKVLVIRNDWFYSQVLVREDTLKDQIFWVPNTFLNFT